MDRRKCLIRRGEAGNHWLSSRGIIVPRNEQAFGNLGGEIFYETNCN